MTSYAVTARIEGISPRFRDRQHPIVPTPATVIDDRAEQDGWIGAAESDHRDPFAGLGGLLQALGETTFYLFDPEGWR